MKLRTMLASIAVALLGATSPLFAQDSHYWTLQYGPRASLLGGAVIGSVDDVSATYYNPGALGIATDLAFAVSANVFEYSGIGLEDGGGEGVDLGTSRSGLRPSLVAGAITKNLFGAGVLAYSVLTRVRGSQDLAGYAILSGEDVPPDLALDDIAGLVQYEGEFSDVWAGLSYSQPLGPNFGLGVTWYGAFRSQRRRGETLTQTIGSDGSGSSAIDIRGGKYSTIRTLLKLGVFGAVGPVTGGVTLTTPSVHITGSGQLGMNAAAFTSDTTALSANIQTGLPAEYKSPLSVGAGGALRIAGTRIHASAEWYDAIGPYVVIQGEDFVSQEPEQVMDLDAVQELAEVVNWGVGVEQAFSGKVSGYASYYSDNSGLNDEIERASLSALPFDINSITVGADFVVSSARFTLGAGYGWGRKLDQNLTNTLRQEDDDFEATFVFRSIRFIFGFEIGI
ncbi:MAG: hypothetical protein JSW71_06570 [Gemmatimonadota bacterium]|nr:MAG: hypothetical protein JSW71_06570 [Gemmatimonadota bacterium]